jgi:hypothetical protein
MTALTFQSRTFVIGMADSVATLDTFADVVKSMASRDSIMNLNPLGIQCRIAGDVGSGRAKADGNRSERESEWFKASTAAVGLRIVAKRMKVSSAISSLTRRPLWDEFANNGSELRESIISGKEI